MPSNKISRWTFFINFFCIYIDGSQLDNLMVSLIMCSSIGWIMQTSKNLFPLILMLVTIWQKKWFIHLFHHMVYICKVGIHFSYGTYLVINNSYPLKIFSKRYSFLAGLSLSGMPHVTDTLWNSILTKLKNAKILIMGTTERMTLKIHVDHLIDAISKNCPNLERLEFRYN